MSITHAVRVGRLPAVGSIVHDVAPAEDMVSEAPRSFVTTTFVGAVDKKSAIWDNMKLGHPLSANRRAVKTFVRAVDTK